MKSITQTEDFVVLLKHRSASPSGEKTELQAEKAFNIS